MNYIQSWIEETPATKATVGAIKRPNGTVLTSAMIGALQSPERCLSSLEDFLDLSLAFLEADGEVALPFPEVPHD